MHFKSFLKRTSALALASIVLFSGTVSVDAKKSIKEMEREKQELQTEVNSLRSKLVDLLTDITELEAEIASNQEDIEATKDELKEAKKAEREQYAAMKERIRYFYENDTNQDLFTLLLESGSFTDFINRISYVNSVYQYDRDRLAAYEATKEEIKAMEADLEKQQVELENEQATLSAKKSDLDTLINSKEGQVADLGSKIQEAKEEAARRAAEEAARRARERAEANARAVRERQEAARRAAEEAARQQQAAQQAASSGDSSGSSSGDSGSESSVPSGGGDPGPVTGISGSSVVAYARQFVGNPYRWGGDSLTSGCDCSGFVVQIYRHFGIDLSGSRQSALLRSVGSAVSYENMQPGDIVCYSGHVAIYAGGGVIVEAQSSRAGITCSRSVTCREILAIRRVI
ncbi:MAG: C40 family peptidase [Lachnospiraceae bacterium]|nr:C40 family peptidase [Lachnospiraceae bacterium]